MRKIFVSWNDLQQYQIPLNHKLGIDNEEHAEEADKKTYKLIREGNKREGYYYDVLVPTLRGMESCVLYQSHIKSNQSIQRNLEFLFEDARQGNIDFDAHIYRAK